MSALEQILTSIREQTPSARDKGTDFERLTKFYLENDPKYDFESVWLWADWANENDRDAQDVGIDLVAKDREEGSIWAIQCKFYAEEKKIYKKDIDSFFTESGKEPFGHRLIVLTTAETSKHVAGAMKGQKTPCSTLNLSDLRESAIDWSSYGEGKKARYQEKKTPRPHQEKAIKATEEGLTAADRGKLLMACGTGKTYTALKIAESEVGAGGRVLFLVPSLALLAQTLNEWTIDTETPLVSYAVCSDVAVGKRRDKDAADITVSDLAYPATTKADRLAEKLEHEHSDKMTVVFSTYHSIQVIADAQAKHGAPGFDLIICDEAHRTTGATLAGEKESHFVKVHDETFINAKKRLYMTATPRVFGETVKEAASEREATLCSMDDETLFGKTFYTLNFSEAVQLGLLADYKVLVLAVDEQHVSDSVQRVLADHGNELKLDDATKIIGCWKALSKLGIKVDLNDPDEMQSAVAFCRDIKTSERIAAFFPQVVEEYIENLEENIEDPLECSVKHVDGGHNAITRKERIDWLKSAHQLKENACHILSNARCLSEGVDVPALDAILFLNPRKSQIDIVQSVGRVMRRAAGKKRGYVILPVAVPAGKQPEEALRDNERYRVIWQVLQALRSHDDRFDASINKIESGVDIRHQMEVVAVTGALRDHKTDTPQEGAIGIGSGGESEAADPVAQLAVQTSFELEIGDLERAIYAKIVKRCGNRRHWEEWAGDIAEIAKTHIARITSAVDSGGAEASKAFDEFLEEIRDDLNDSITKADAIEMLAQHVITKPIFDALFEDHNFTANNPVSKAMQGILGILSQQNLDSESETLQKFYKTVQMRVRGITDYAAKQKIIVELYDKFFRNAFPKMTEQLGIVYTPVEVVDFILHSVNDVLKEEFGETLGSEGVHILDPFTGTGTFITRLLLSGLVKPEELKNKYENELHANEMVLLAYYIAAINIEAVYHALTEEDYTPFGGMCLTDTFQLYEKDDGVADLFVDNSTRRVRQKELDIRVIVGNPPYTAAKKVAAGGVLYPNLDGSIRETYAKHTNATLVNALYDSYIRAIRWATDRVGEAGVVAFVTNAGWIDGNAMDGLRKCLVEEFDRLYIFHLRGNQRTSGERSRKEGGKIFGSGSRAPIAISVLVKTERKEGQKGEILFHDIGDYLKREEKLARIAALGSVGEMSRKKAWKKIEPDEHNDWVNKRVKGVDSFWPLGAKKADAGPSIFANHSSGIKTNRDAWCYNSSRAKVAANMERMIATYNAEVERYLKTGPVDRPQPAKFVVSNPAKIKWTREILKSLVLGQKRDYQGAHVVNSVYRPFGKQWAYFDRYFNNCTYQMPKLFPSEGGENRVIAVTGKGGKGFGAMMFALLPDIQSMFNGQCFPLKLYDNGMETGQANLFEGNRENCKDGITDEALEHFGEKYPGEKIAKEDIFYYIYGLLHSEEYREKFKNNLTKELPRIPRVSTAKDFWAFSTAGRELGELHVNYEEVAPYPVSYKNDLDIEKLAQEGLRVEKMKFGKAGKEKDKSTIIYNKKITITGVPLEAYDYVVNGKPAIEWVMERQCVKTDKKSGIVNDANDYAIETMNDPAYPLKLLQSVITVSLETMKIVKELPSLDIE